MLVDICIVIRNGKIVWKLAVLLIFLLELEIPGVAVQSIHQNSEKILTFVSNCFVKMTSRLFQPLSAVMTMVPRLLRHFRRSLQIRKSIANAPRVTQFADQSKYTDQSITVKNGDLLRKLKKLLKLHGKKSNNQPMVRFIHKRSEITTCMGYSFKTKTTKFKARFLT